MFVWINTEGKFLRWYTGGPIGSIYYEFVDNINDATVAQAIDVPNIVNVKTLLRLPAKEERRVLLVINT